MFAGNGNFSVEMLWIKLTCLAVFIVNALIKCTGENCTVTFQEGTNGFITVNKSASNAFITFNLTKECCLINTTKVELKVTADNKSNTAPFYCGLVANKKSQTCPCIFDRSYSVNVGMNSSVKNMPIIYVLKVYRQDGRAPKMSGQIKIAKSVGPPEILRDEYSFQVNSSTNTVHLKFNVITYSSNITNCTVTRVSDNGNDRPPVLLTRDECHRQNISPLGEKTRVDFIITNAFSNYTGKWQMTLRDIFGESNSMPFTITGPPKILQEQYSFQVNSSTNTVYLKFNVITYSSNITNCTVTRVSNNGSVGPPVLLTGDECYRENISPLGEKTRVDFIITDAFSNYTGKWQMTLRDIFGESNSMHFIIPGPPEILTGEYSFQVNSSTNTVHLKFNVTTYSSNITNCSFTRVSGNDSVRPPVLPTGDECHRENMSPPGEITQVKFIINNVFSNHSGKWEITLRDIFGESNSMPFTITALNTTDPQTAWQGPAVMISAIVSVVAIMVVVVFVAITCHKRNAAVAKRSSHRRPEGIMRYQRDLLYRGSNVSMMVSNDIYETCERFVQSGNDGCANDRVVSACQETPPQNHRNDYVDIENGCTNGQLAGDCDRPPRHNTHDPETVGTL